MICNVTSEKQRKLRRVIARDIIDNGLQDQPFDLKSYVQSIYHMVKDQTDDHGRAIDYARLTPFFIDQIASSDTQLLRGLMKNGLDRNSLTDLILEVDDPNVGIEAMEQYIGLRDDIVEELKQLNEKQEEEPSAEAKESAPEIVDAKTPTNRLQQPAVEVRDEKVTTKRKEFKASPPTMQADVAFESSSELPYQVPDPNQEFYFKVKRNIIKMLSESDGDFDSTNLNLPGYGPVYLTAVPATRIPEEHLRPNVDLSIPEIKAAHETGVVLALTTADGQFVHFDKDTGLAADYFGDNVAPAYYSLRNTKDVVKEDGTIEFGKYEKKVAESLANQIKKGKVPTTEERAAANQMVERETKRIHDIRKYVIENNSEIRTAITGGTLGYTKFDYVSINNPIKDVNFDGEIFDPKPPTEAEIEQGLIPGAYYFKLDSMYDRPIEIERGYIKDSGLKETIIGLLTDDLVREDSRGNIVPVDYQMRRDLIKPYLNTNRDTIQVLSNNEGGHSIRLLGNVYPMSTPEQREGMKEILSRYFSNLIPSRAISSPRGKTVIKAGDTSKYRLGSVVEVPVKGGKNKYYVVEYAKHNIDREAMASDQFTSVDELVPLDNGTVQVMTSTKSYKNDYVRNNFNIHYELNAEKKLVRLDSYFTFSPLKDDLEKIYKTEEEEEKEIQEVIDNAPVQTSILEEGPGDVSIESLLQQNWEDPELQKNLFVKNTDKAAVKKQIAEAKEWYENSPLNKHFPFTTMFNVVNRKNAGAIATWSMNGITLFKGADYSDLYHEAWHGFTQAFLTKDDKVALYNEARKKSGSFTDYTGKRVSFNKATNLQLEEFLAEDFRNYMLKGQKAKKKQVKRNTIFRRIYNFLKALFSNQSVEDIALGQNSNKLINDLYEKLRVGNLSEYSFSQDNVSFGELNTGIQPFGKSFDDSLKYEDSMLVVETMDSLISEFVDMSNSGLMPNEKKELAELEAKSQNNRITPEERASLNARMTALRNKQTYNFTSKLLKTRLGRTRTYKYVQFRLSQMAKELAKNFEEESNPVEQAKIKKKLDLLSYTLRNYGDSNNLSNNRPDSETGDINGVIAYHANKSQVLEREDLDVIFAEAKEESFVQARDGISRLGNESSPTDLAATEIITILNTLYQYDSEGNLVKNKLGVNKITPFREVWNRMLRMLSGLSAPEMERVLKEQAADYPAINHLLSKLGPLETGSMTEDRLWTSFWRTFNLTKESLTQMTIDKIDGEYQSRIGDATGELRKIGRDWESEFKSNHDNPYVKVNADGQLFLDVPKVLRDFPAKTLSKNRWDFFRAIGFNLSDKQEIKDAIANDNVGGAKYYRERLENLAKRGDVQITDFTTLNKEYKSKKVGEVLIGSLPDQVTRFKALQELELKYSDRYASTMVNTASGNSQSEYTLNSTLTQLVNKLNKSRDIELKNGKVITAYNALISNKETAHFNLERNPILRGSVLFNSLFKLDVDPSSPEYGKRRRTTDKSDAPFVEIKLSNLSGVLLQREGITQGEGTDTSDTDPHTKLIQDLHLMVQHASPELLRHGDKGTYHSAVPNKFFAGGKQKDMYVDTVDFLRGNYGHDQAVDILVGHIGAELDRVNIMRNAVENGLDSNFDKQYVTRGKEFVAFDKMLSADTKKSLYELEVPLSEYLEEGSPESKILKQTISNEIQEYFGKQYNSLSLRFSEAEFISDSLMNKIVGQGANVRGESVEPIEARKAMLESLLYNTWIHNIESMAVFYGDIAQFKVEKDEVHKRNSGIASTGLLSRTDKSKVDFINRVIGRDYAKSIGVLEPKAFDGTFSTAVIKDKETKSAYMKEYTEVLGEKGAKEYGSMTEADAMGVIGFDAYRILKNTQGQWLPQHEAMYQEIVNGKSVDPKKVKDIFFPTIKAQYFGPLQTEQLSLTAFHKFELFPLIPNVISGSPKLKALHEKMTKEGVDYLLFESGSKAATITKDGTPDQFYDENREIITDPEHTFTKNNIFLDYLKDQLEIAPKFKGKVTFPTQLRTLIEEGTFENGLPVDFMTDKSYDERLKVWNKLSEANRKEASPRYALVNKFEGYINRVTAIKKKELLKKANWSVNDKGELEGNIEDLVKFLKREMARLDMGDHEIDFLAVHDGKLKHDLSMALFADKLEKTLQAIVTKELINQKVTGEGLIQVSGALFETGASMVDRNYTNPTEEETAKWGSNDLPTYHKGKDGKTAAMKVKVALQGEFTKLLQMKDLDGNRIGTLQRLNEVIKDENWLNENDNRRMITMVGVRIPVQGLNSMEFMEVQEFLPTTAGNIIVPPAEIVAKSGSDFDIDKLTVMMPSFERTADGVKLKRTYDKNNKEAKELYEKYKEATIEREKLKDSDGNKIDITKLRDYRLNPEEEEFAKREEVLNPYNNLIEAIFGMSMTEIDEEFEDILLEEGTLKTFDEFLDKLNGLKSAENDLIWSIKEILEQPFNYANLIRPNDTDLVKPTADDYAKNVYGRDKSIAPSGSDVLSYEYNLNKHHSNTAGKKTLSIGAVGNKWNPLFNRVGMKLNPSAGITEARRNQLLELKSKRKLDKFERSELESYKRQVLKLPHHKIPIDVEGEMLEGISLGESMDVNGENRISDIINQMMNGWLDIAKDDWIFDIQGIQELTPSIEFMLEAGVPFKQAIAMVSIPLVREYVKEQQLSSSSLAEALGKGVSKSRMKTTVKENILSNPQYGFVSKSGTPFGNSNVKKWLKENTDALVEEGLGEDDTFTQDKLYKLSTGHKKAIDSNKKPGYGPYQRAAFLHFLEIEEMANAMRDIKLRLNVDTSRTGTFYEIQNKISLKNELLFDSRFPTDIIDKIINDSPISSFFIQEFQQEIYKDMFLIRNHKAVNSMIQNDISKNDVAITYGKKEIFANEFRNDLMNFIFQNSIGSFNIDAIESYKGISVEREFPIQEVQGLNYGAFVQDGVMYIDKQTMFNQFMDESYATEAAEGLATIPAGSFKTAKDYYRYVLEREALRNSLSFESVKDTPEYERVRNRHYSDIVLNESEELGEEFDKRANKIIYELYLTKKALNNVNNMWKLFNSEDTYADEFRHIRDKYPELVDDFAIMKQLSISATDEFRNLKLNDASLTGDLINLYNENIKLLADPTVKKVDDIAGNDYISDFFNRFATVALLQSGQNTKSAFSMVRVVPQELITELMDRPVKEYKKHFDKAAEEYKTPPILQEFKNQFVSNNIDSGTRIRGKNYSSELTLSKSKKMLLNDETIEDTFQVEPTAPIEPALVEPEVTSEETTEESSDNKINVPLNTVTDQTVRDFMNKCFGI